MLPFSRTDDVSGLTWGGQSYETSDGIVSGALSVTTLPITGSTTPAFSLAASEAVLLTFN